ncbi:UDP-N-acetylmuramate dehydrogenase [Stenotrophomonas sp. PFBMAA-4]|uniref:UDP-N-acetylmuramate dehydrogenase n=1 Tax=Stenotrophomonas sp. PFBMAA-4 TaxID=3043301 RepID=UPI0024B60AE0|nr:UDP-N-acetylmuramate dehydrogenase [Stenotrophomonas sp. PFBMAA-4]MDI9271873.1 UDP-N-acetylmuramate dehydrogenase [Stenotrophomonas sp. PFBMAA-4]
MSVKPGSQEIDRLAELLSTELPNQVSRNVSLATISRWKIGGNAAIYVEPTSVAAAARVMAIMAGRPEPFFVMGDSSNTLFDDAGFAGVVMRIGRNLSAMRVEGTRVWSQAGIWVPKLALATSDAGLGGLEHTTGIPGTLGGLVVMNGGSQRKGVGASVTEVLCADESGELFRMDQRQCGFAYRTSSLQSRRVVVLEVELELKPRLRNESRAEMLAIVRDRRRKFPQKLPNCGSTFLSNPSMYEHIGPPGLAIEQSGLKGLRKGGAVVSTLHANFIVNDGGATCVDVLWLIGHIRETVRQRTGYEMDCEVRHLSPTGELRAAHISAQQIYFREVESA